MRDGGGKSRARSSSSADAARTIVLNSRVNAMQPSATGQMSELARTLRESVVFLSLPAYLPFWLSTPNPLPLVPCTLNSPTSQFSNPRT